MYQNRRTRDGQDRDRPSKTVYLALSTTPVNAASGRQQAVVRSSRRTYNNLDKDLERRHGNG